MKILHTADIHLREDNIERWNALSGIVTLAKKERINAMVISGDLFDADIDAFRLKARVRELFSDAPFDIIVIPGNHDAKSFEDKAFFGSRVKVLRSVEDTYEAGNVIISGIPFKNINEQEIFSILHNISGRLSRDKCNILLYHGELLDAYYSRHDFGDEGDYRYMPVRLDFFKDLKFDYVLAGHFHTNFNAMEFDKLNGIGYFVIPGSPVSVTKRETGKRKVNIFNTGESPGEVFVDSFYYEAVKIVLDPFVEDDPVTVIKKTLDKADAQARILLSIEGYINSSKHGINETKLHEELELLSNIKKINEVNFRAIDMSRILEDDVFKAFDAKLKSPAFSSLPFSEKAAMREYFLRAMMESFV
ncbi:MAG: metallophosphoesterase [Spirochaetota bacterium]